MSPRLWARVLALALLLAPLGAAAQVVCPGGPADFDLDGFTDQQECAGLALVPGLQVKNGGALTLPRCTTGVPRDLCMDPSTRDLFLIDEIRADLPLPADALTRLSGLGFTLHRLVRTVASTDRTVSPASLQKAVQITTAPDTGDGVLGRANWGTPNGLDGATVYPNRIATYVNGLCPAGTVCQTNTGVVGAANIIALLTRWVADHEVGHTVGLAKVYDSRFGGYHEASGSLTVMEQTPKVVSKRGSVTFYIATSFSSASVVDATLAGTQ
jgi:hypothetical protein